MFPVSYLHLFGKINSDVRAGTHSPDRSRSLSVVLVLLRRITERRGHEVVGFEVDFCSSKIPLFSGLHVVCRRFFRTFVFFFLVHLNVVF